MGDTVNLNTFRKAKARAEKKARADANAVKFGQTKEQKALEKARAEMAARELAAHRRETDGSEQ